MYALLKMKETELKSREEELERISVRQQAYESMLRQRELALEEREKDLVIRELTVALQQLNSQPQVVQPPPPEPKKRRHRVGSRLTNFLRSSSHNSHHEKNTNPPNNVIPNQPVNTTASLTTAKSIDISTPSDFQHCLSVQQEMLHTHSSSNMQLFNSMSMSQAGSMSGGVCCSSASLKPSLSSTPTEEQCGNGNNNDVNSLLSYQTSSANFSSAGGGMNTSNSHLIFPPTANGSPNLRLRVMGNYKNFFFFEKYEKMSKLFYLENKKNT